MKSLRLRNLAFILHRYIGLAVGLLLIVIGLTGSLLVFQQEVDQWMIAQQYGQIVPQQQQVSPEVITNTVQAAYAARNDLNLDRLILPEAPDLPYTARLYSTDGEQRTDVFIHPYTGAILGERQWNTTVIGLLLEFHYTLLAGETGITIVGIAGLLMCILTITGIFLWPGWRKLVAGFKIKWNAHPKRITFDIHKVVGITAAVFLFLANFTGFCWNFPDFTEPIIYAATLTPKPSEPVSKPILGKSPLRLKKQLKVANAALPGAITKSIYFPKLPEEALRIRMKLPQEDIEYGSSNVYLDQYTGEVLQADNAFKIPLGDRVLNSFTPLHYGTFWGLPSRIFYVFVGLAPLILFITGFVMWWHRK